MRGGRAADLAHPSRPGIVPTSAVVKREICRYRPRMRGRLPANVILRPADLAMLERVFAQVIPEHDTHPDELAMLLVRLFQDGVTDERELLIAAEKWFR